MGLATSIKYSVQSGNVAFNSSGYPTGFSDAPLLHDNSVQDSTTGYATSNATTTSTLFSVIDLGSAQTVTAAKGYSATAQGDNSGALYYSDDGSTWTQHTGSIADGAFNISVASLSHRYWGFKGLSFGARTQPDSFTMYDFRLFNGASEYTYGGVTRRRSGSAEMY